MKLRGTTLDAIITIDRDEKRIIAFLEKTFDDIDFHEACEENWSLYETIATKDDLNLLAEYIFDEGNGYYQVVVADEPNYYMHILKEIRFQTEPRCPICANNHSAMIRICEEHQKLLLSK